MKSKEWILTKLADLQTEKQRLYEMGVTWPLALQSLDHDIELYKEILEPD